MTRGAVAWLVPALLASGAAAGEAAGPGPDALAAWDAHAARTAAHAQTCVASGRCGREHVHGELMPVSGGTIHHWRGSTVARSTTVERVLRALQYPGTPPQQEDVLEARVLRHSGDRLRVALTLVRSAIVTVIYDTEHEVAFERLGPGRAASRSVAVRIAERGGADRGFLWRLNSYWTYTQVGGDVRIDLESISLSRAIPAIARPVVAPLAMRIGRESMERTLRSVRTFLER